MYELQVDDSLFLPPSLRHVHTGVPARLRLQRQDLRERVRPAARHLQRGGARI